MFESTLLRDTVAIVSLSALGLLAGMMLGIFIAGYAARGLPEESWTLRFQLENRLFTRTMPLTLMLPLLGLIASVLLTRDAVRFLFAVAAVLTPIVLVITIALEVPINRLVASWTAGAAPANWVRIPTIVNTWTAHREHPGDRSEATCFRSERRDVFFGFLSGG